MPLLFVCSRCGHIDSAFAFRVKKLDGEYTGEVRCPKCGDDFEIGCNQISDEAGRSG